MGGLNQRCNEQHNGERASIMGHGIKRFTNVKNLKGVGRSLLGKCFDKFKEEINEKAIELPAVSLSDDKYYEALKQLFLAPKELPNEMIEFLYAVGDMGNEIGEQRLRKAADAK